MNDLPECPGFLSALWDTVQAHGWRPALQSSSGVETRYDQLWAQAQALSQRLRHQGLTRESLVGLNLAKGPEYVMALLAVWMADAAFLPLHPALPEARLAFYTQAARPQLVINQDFLTHTTQQMKRTPLPSNQAITRISCLPEQAAYTLFSSGSTGTPKGVVVTHSGLLSMLRAQIEAFALTPDSRVLFYLSTQFDASISDIGTCLLAGATLCFEAEETLAQDHGLLRCLKDRHISHADLPPALLPHLSPTALPDCLTTIVFGGEPCAPEVVRAHSRRRRLVCVYGPTEATICTSLTLCDSTSWTRPYLGAPLPGVHYSVRDLAGRVLPHGQPGELYIGGPQLARGYLNASLTAQKFTCGEGSRLYRSGDRVVVHRAGVYEFLGRMDRQFKLDGALIAPEEVEAALACIPGIQRAAVLKRKSGWRWQLVAFLQGAQQPTQTLRLELRQHLPFWMLPHSFVFLKTLPETSSGKLDYQQLQEWPLQDPQENAPPPDASNGGPLLRLHSLWCLVLGLREATPQQHFFEEGGNSLALARFTTLARLQGLNLSAALVYEKPRLGDLMATLAHPPSDLMSGHQLAGLLPARLELGSATVGDPAAGSPAAQPPQKAEVILLTGATGFLGLGLLARLLPESRHIYCLVRPAQGLSAQERLHQAWAKLQRGPLPHKVKVLTGDLTQPKFGLPPEHWQHLCLEVDTIFHLAAHLDALAPASILVASEVAATQEVCSFQANGRCKYLHHVSTLALVLADQEASVYAAESHIHEIPHFRGGYGASKAAAEKILAAANAGPTCIYRPGLVVAEAGDAQPHDLLAALVTGLKRLGCVYISNEPAWLDLTPRSYCLDALLGMALQAMKTSETGVFVIANPTPMTRANLLTQLADNLNLTKVDAATFAAALNALVLAEAELEPMLALACAQLLYSANNHDPSLLFARGAGVLQMPRSMKALADLGLACAPQLHTTYLSPCLSVGDL